jgi:hypothetical protein
VDRGRWGFAINDLNEARRVASTKDLRPERDER